MCRGNYRAVNYPVALLNLETINDVIFEGRFMLR